MALKVTGGRRSCGAHSVPFAIVGVIIRSGRHARRVAITPCDIHGRATGPSIGSASPTEHQRRHDRQRSPATAPSAAGHLGPLRPVGHALRPAVEDTRSCGETPGLWDAAEATALPGPDADSVRTWAMEYVQLAETPGGERFSVVVAPPGSALDAGGQFPAGGALGSMIAVIRMIFRSSRRGWRVGVTRCDIHGRATGAAHRERVADEEAAMTRWQAILGAIRTGQWPGPSGA